MILKFELFSTFNFIQQMLFVPKACDRYRSPPLLQVGDECKWFFDSVGFTPRLNEVKPPADVMDFFKGSLSSKLDKNPDANSTGEFD